MKKEHITTKLLKYNIKTNISKPYIRKERQIEGGTGLGLNICSAILEEHGFRMTCRKSTQGGTIISVHIGETNNEDK